jgi:hypothetical protein
MYLLITNGHERTFFACMLAGPKYVPSKDVNTLLLCAIKILAIDKLDAVDKMTSVLCAVRTGL